MGKITRVVQLVQIKPSIFSLLVLLCAFLDLQVQAKPYLQAGAYEIVDEHLEGTFDVQSMRKTALVAVRSVERDASQRPTIAEVLAELKEAFSIQLSYLQSRNV